MSLFYKFSLRLCGILQLSLGRVLRTSFFPSLSHSNIQKTHKICPISFSFISSFVLPCFFFSESKMAIGRARSNKRSSASSYMPTVTMVIFIALCFLVLWVLTSSNFPRHTSRSSNPFSSTNTHFVKPNRQQRDPPAFDDTPGDLPDDVIKGDVYNNKPDEPTKPQEEEKETALLPETRSNPVVGKTKTKTTEKESNIEAESQEEKSMDSKNHGDNTSITNEEQEKDQSSTTAENPKNQQRKESVEEEKQEEESVENQQTQQETNENQQVSTQKNEESEETKTRVEESRGNQDQSQQETQEVEREKNYQQTQQDQHSEGQTSEEDLQQQTQKEKQETSEISRDETYQQSSQTYIQETTSDEHETQTTEDQNSQQKEGESTPVENHETQQNENTSVENQESQQNEDNQESQQGKNQETQQEKTEEEQPASSQETTNEEQSEESNSGESFTDGVQSEIPKESKESKREWSTQAGESEHEKKRRKEGRKKGKEENMEEYSWELCNVTAGPDYIPCLDNEKALKHLHTTGHYEHRERHCPEEGPTCLVPVPQGYKHSIQWPKSRDKIWYHNVPHTKLAEVKGHQNWVKMTGEFLTFPGGGTQFIHGALHYIDFIQEAVPNIAWGKHTRVILDVGCGVASFGGYLFERDVLAMSFAPKDEHEAQVQFALERGIPAISAVMGSQRLQFPSKVFDLVHCARCRVPWHGEGGTLLLELNRVLRPGGYFVWSATPVYQKLKEDVEIWKAMSSLTKSMCWDLITIKRDKLNSIGAAIYRKPISNECYDHRKHHSPPMCKDEDDPNAAWYVPLQACMHKLPVDRAERGSQWPEDWPVRLQTPPYWLNISQKGIYGKPAPDDFAADYEHWKQEVSQLYLSGLGISWSNVRNVMDMRAVYGGFAAALKDLKVWVLNVVNVDSPDTLPIIYERGLFGIYHDWCESFSTYPRTYDLLHADHLLSRLVKRCKIVPVMAEMDRIVRPGGKLIVRDESSTLEEVENMLKSLHWEIQFISSKDKEGILSAQKSDWRPESYSASS